MLTNEQKSMDKIVDLCKSRGFVYPGSEIYGGLANSWDYGPLGVELKNNIKRAWWKKFVQESPYNVGLDASIIMNPETWVASGHLGGFSDPLMDCKSCKTRHRADNLIEDFDGTNPAGWTNQQMMDYIREKQIPCPNCGKTDFKAVSAAMRDAFSAMPRGEIDYDIGTDLRMNAVEDHIRFVEEEMDVTQGKLVLGFRLGECMEEPDIPALYVFNAVYGSGATSKLFMNVREKLSLCYYASSAVYLHKGIMLVSSGIEFDKLDAARDEILAQLDSVRRGEITDDELRSAKKSVASDLRAVQDSIGELEGFYLSQAIDGLDYGPAELAALAEDVTKEDVQAIAESIECDLIYFLKGSGEEDGSDDETA